MNFDFMKEFMMFEDEERFASLCERLEEVIRDADDGEGKLSELEIMQALDYVGFNLLRDNWKEYKKMDMLNHDQNFSPSAKGKEKRYIH